MMSNSQRPRELREQTRGSVGVRGPVVWLGGVSSPPLPPLTHSRLCGQGEALPTEPEVSGQTRPDPPYSPGAGAGLGVLWAVSPGAGWERQCPGPRGWSVVWPLRPCGPWSGGAWPKLPVSIGGLRPGAGVGKETPCLRGRGCGRARTSLPSTCLRHTRATAPRKGSWPGESGVGDSRRPTGSAGRLYLWQPHSVLRAAGHSPLPRAWDQILGYGPHQRSPAFLAPATSAPMRL